MRAAVEHLAGVGLARQRRAHAVEVAAQLGLIAEQLPHAAQHLARRVAGVDEELLQAHVRVVEQQHALGVVAVAPAAAGFLVVGLGAARYVGVDDHANVSLVHAHAEGVGGDDGVELAGHERVLRARAGAVVETGVVDASAHAGASQRLAVLLGVLARGGVDQRGAARARAHQIDQPRRLVGGAAGARHRPAKVGPVEAAHVEARRLHVQLLGDVEAHLRRGGGGQRHQSRRRQTDDRVPQLAVVGAKLVPPLADAVGLVDGQQRQRVADLGQRVEEARAAEPLGRDVDQPVVASADAGENFPLLLRRGGAGQGGGRDPAGAQAVHLVLHQGDQRRDHQGDPTLLPENDRRQLITQRFSCTRGHHRDHRVAGQDVGDGLGLARAQGGESEYLGQRAPGGGIEAVTVRCRGHRPRP